MHWLMDILRYLACMYVAAVNPDRRDPPHVFDIEELWQQVMAARRIEEAHDRHQSDMPRKN